MSTPLIQCYAPDCADALQALFMAPERQLKLVSTAQTYQGASVTAVAIRTARPKLEDAWPSVVFELLSEDAPHGAMMHVRDDTIMLNVIVGVRILGGSHPAQEKIDRYVATLAGFVWATINMPENRVLVLPNDIRTYDSNAGQIVYGYLHNGSVRAAQFQWTGKIWLHPVQVIEPAPLP